MLPIMFNVSFLFQKHPTPSAPAHGPLERLGHRFEYFRQLLFKCLIQLMLDPSKHIYLLKTENQHLTWWQGNAKKKNPPNLIQYKIIISIDPWKNWSFALHPRGNVSRRLKCFCACLCPSPVVLYRICITPGIVVVYYAVRKWSFGFCPPQLDIILDVRNLWRISS